MSMPIFSTMSESNQSSKNILYKKNELLFAKQPSVEFMLQKMVEALLHFRYSTTYHSRANECLQKIKGTDFGVFVLI